MAPTEDAPNSFCWGLEGPTGVEKCRLLGRGRGILEQRVGICLLVVKCSPVPEREASGGGEGGAVKKLRAQKARDALSFTCE